MNGIIIQLFGATDTKGRFVTYFRTSNSLFVSMDEVRPQTLCCRNVLGIYQTTAVVRFRFARMRLKQRNSALIETESARSTSKVSSLVIPYTRGRKGGGGAGKVVNYGGMTDDRSSDNR